MIDIDTCTVHRVAERHEARSRIAAVMYRGKDYTWGFLSAGPPRMHATTMDRHQRGRYWVWLESVPGGTRMVQPDGYVPPEALEGLQEWLDDIEHRDQVEKVWVNYMRAKGWLRTKGHGTWVQVVAYPEQPTEFTREMSFSGCPVWVTDDDITITNDAVIEVSQGSDSAAVLATSLPSLLWED